MSKLKRSRALRRNLRKQARKGTLSARERKTLLQQEKRFRKARRPFMRGLGFGAGLGTGALLVPGVAGLISGLGGIRPGKEDPDEDPGQDPEVMEDELGRNPNALFYDVEEQPSNQVVGGPGAVEDVVVVGEEEEEEEEDAAEERQATPEDQARAERAAQRAERSREAGVDAALEAGLDEAESPGGDLEEAKRQAAQVEGVRDRKYYGTTLPASFGFTGSKDTYDKRKGRPFTEGRFEDFDPTRDLQLGGSEYSEGEDERFRLAMRAPQTDYTGGFEFLPADDPMEAVRRRPAAAIPVDRPDPRAGSTLDPRLPGVIDRARRSPLFMRQGGRVDKSNDLVARIKRKYGLR